MGKGRSSQVVPAVTPLPHWTHPPRGSRPISAQHWADHAKLQPDPATLSLRPKPTGPAWSHISAALRDWGGGGAAGPEPTQTRPGLNSCKLQAVAGKPCAGPATTASWGTQERMLEDPRPKGHTSRKMISSTCLMIQR